MNIQHNQGIASKGYQVNPVRTGYERVLPHRTTDMFAATAKQPGKVTDLNETAITVTHEDESKTVVELGRRFGKAAENVYPHDIKTELTVGDTLIPGDCIAYNVNFFKKDPFNHKRVVWMSGALATVALMEASDTFEDSSAISEDMAKKMGSYSTKVRTLNFDFDQSVKNLVKPGDELDSDSVLCIIEDAVTADNDLFTQDTIDTLKLLSGNTPRAKYRGVVEKVEVLYFGNKSDMSPALKAVADRSDKAMADRQKKLGKPTMSGKLQDSLRVDNRIVGENEVLIKVYITQEQAYGVGDKSVVSHQLKTVTTRKMHGVNQTEDGTPIDLIFGGVSIDNRIVESPFMMGTTISLLQKVSKNAVKIYKGESLDD